MKKISLTNSTAAKFYRLLFFAFLSLIFDPFLAFAEKLPDENLSFEVIAKKLDSSRSNISPKTGSSNFSFKQSDIDNLPQGQAASLNQVLLRAPSVAQDSYGQIHVRGDHSNLQYRINDIIIPEGINGFGQVLDARFADSIDLITGALPAQYGYRTAGVVEIKTKDRVGRNQIKASDKKTGDKQENQGLIANGYSEAMVGSFDNVGFNQQLSGQKQGFNYFLSGSYLQNQRGLESPTGSKNSLHNQTKQDRFFGYFSHLLGENKRLGLIVANSTNRFEIPNNPGQIPQFQLAGISDSGSIKSDSLNQKQRESNRFAIASIQGLGSEIGDYQIAGFVRESKNLFRGDYVGDLVFNGVASNIDRTSLVSGFQGDLSKEINNQNTLRYGFYASDTAVKVAQGNSLFQTITDAKGEVTQASDIPSAVNNRSKIHSQLYSLYIQNEYRPISSFKINIGGRYDKAKVANNEQQFSPRFGGVYDFSEKTKFHAGYARYFTAPKAELLSNLNLEEFRDTTNQPYNFNNSNVKAERSDYYDLGVSHRVSRFWNLALTGFIKNSKNLLDEGQFGNALIFKPFNYAQGKTQGVELANDFRFGNFSAFLNATLQKSQAKRINSSQYLFEEAELEHIDGNFVNTDHAQKITASLGAAYKLAPQKSEIGFDALYGNGLRRGDFNKNRMPSYWQLNLFATKRIGEFKFRLAVNNVLDARYALRNGSGIGIQASQFAARRNFLLIASRDF